MMAGYRLVMENLKLKVASQKHIAIINVQWVLRLWAFFKVTCWPEIDKQLEKL